MPKNTSHSHFSKRGLTLPINGEPVQEIEPAKSVSKVAIVADDYVGMRPRVLVAEGNAVKRGQALLEDRAMPGIFVTSPGAGIVSAINRGEQRVLRSVVIDLDEANDCNEIKYSSYRSVDPTQLSSADIQAALVECGLWTALRTRPFSRTPALGSSPRSIFVTAMDTNPLAPDPAVVLRGNEKHFERGLSVLSKLPDGGKVYVCVKAGTPIKVGDAPSIEVHEYKGPHPCGTAGFHIHTIEPAGRDRVMWHIGYQDVAAIGYFFATGALLTDRVIALAGPKAARPRLIKTRLGASIDELVSGETKGDHNLAISGSVLSGRKAMGEIDGFLGRFHNQVTVLDEGGTRRFLGWLAPGFDRFSILNLFASKLCPQRKLDFNADINGQKRGIVPTGSYEKVMPFDLMPTFLLKAIVSKDMEKAEELGVLELDEEDVALCTFVCASKNDYGQALRELLTRMEKEG